VSTMLTTQSHVGVPEPPLNLDPPPCATNMKKSASDGQVGGDNGAGARRSSNPVLGSSKHKSCQEGGVRRSSDGDAISIMESSTDGIEGEPGSPLGWGRVDWTETASSMAHVFVSTSSSIDNCYLQSECLHSGHRVKCVACRVISHEGCISTLNDRFPCKETFRECVRTYREQTVILHHWVTRKQLKGRCHNCGKLFLSKLGSKFSSQIAIGVICSWCKVAYHKTDHCFDAKKENNICDLGLHKKIIIPPSWIIKLPRKGSFKSSLKHSPKRSASSAGSDGISIVEIVRKNGRIGAPAAITAPSIGGGASGGKNSQQNSFVLKPIPSPSLCPVIVFVNPKSGGNQGAKLMQKFQWLLNPRQVFDLSQGGPDPALELYKRVPGMRLLACGGDGTVGWLLSCLDKLDNDDQHHNLQAAVGVLPLGTGNDLSRSLGWGGGYTDEPLSKILQSLQQAEVINMDRWRLRLDLNSDHSAKISGKGVDKLPLEVVNNYFSLGVDAQIALQFHEAREANPHKFNSRIRNKMFYTQAGGKDLILRKWRTLTEHITVECDGKDITGKLRELKVHSVVFSNIPSYSSGTRPWNRQFGDQRLDDGLIEVIGLTTYQMPMIQVGGHGHCITQCSSARITTRKTIPMQVDGEAVRMNPCVIELSLLNQAKMLSKRKSGSKTSSQELRAEIVNVDVSRISMQEYQQYYCDKEILRLLAKPFGVIKVDSYADLEIIRHHVEKLGEDKEPKLLPDWCFLDAVTAERLFRIDRDQETLHYLHDICDQHLFIVEMEENIEELQNNLTISPLIGDDTPPPRSPLTPSPSPFDSDTLHPPSQEFPLRITPTPDKIDIPKKTSLAKRSIEYKIPIFGVTPPDDDRSRKTTDGILKAARLGDLKMLTELYYEGYSLMSTDETGKTGLHYGARFGHKDIIKFLIEKSEDKKLIMDWKDNEKGQTALHKAAAYKRRTICQILVNAGASVSVLDECGQTARQLASAAEDHELTSYLEGQERIQLSRKDFETAV